MTFCDMTVTRSQAWLQASGEAGESPSNIWLPVGRASAESWHLAGRAEERQQFAVLWNGILGHLVGCKGDFATCSKVYTMGINTA